MESKLGPTEESWWGFVVFDSDSVHGFGFPLRRKVNWDDLDLLPWREGDKLDPPDPE